MKEKLMNIAKNKKLHLILNMLLPIVISIPMFQYLPTYESIVLICLIAACCLYELAIFFKEKAYNDLLKRFEELLEVTRDVHNDAADLLKINNKLFEVIKRQEHIQK